MAWIRPDTVYETIAVGDRLPSGARVLAVENDTVPSGRGIVRIRVEARKGDDTGVWHEWQFPETTYGEAAQHSEWLESVG